ncbi:hypothetical protein MalM25_11850 [Planctomycetes bacterium MalM25]|nr:hypothetical protein MalM25_11850 [Planctomycetes bacterium MalM25]
MLSLGTCRLCQAGPLGLRRCGVCRRVVVLCDECDAAWPTSETSGRPTYATKDDMPCPCCRGSLLGKGSHWASRDELAAIDWPIDHDALEEGSDREPSAHD